MPDLTGHGRPILLKEFNATFYLQGDGIGRKKFSFSWVRARNNSEGKIESNASMTTDVPSGLSPVIWREWGMDLEQAIPAAEDVARRYMVAEFRAVETMERSITHFTEPFLKEPRR